MTGGDETKVGYYVGMLVRVLAIRALAGVAHGGTAIVVLLDAGADSSPLEPGVGPGRTKAGDPHRLVRLVAVDVLFWSVADLLGIGPEVRAWRPGDGIVGLTPSDSRSLNGALNGNIGVIKSVMAELTDETNIAQVYAYMPIAWSTGGTLGSALPSVPEPVY